MRELQTSTLSNQNISSDLLAATYTADADRAVVIDVVLDQVAGGWDYIAYVTKQKLGSGSFYKSPLSYNTAAAGVTAVWFTGIILAVKNTDVIKVYVKGLAGDTTTPDVTVSVCELSYLRPTVAGRTLDIAATGEAGLDFDNVHDAASAHALANISVPEIWNALLTAFTTSGSVGKLLKDDLNAAVGSIPTNPLLTNDARLPATVIAAKADVPTVVEVQSGLATAAGVGSPLQADDERLPETVLAAKADVPTVAAIQSGLATAEGMGSPLQSDDSRLPETILAAAADVPSSTDIDAQLSGVHGSGRWGAGNGGAASISDVITDDVTELPVADVIVTLYSDVLRANALDQQVTDESGAYTFTNLIAGTYSLRASKAGEYRNEDFTKVAA
jgi:hypothetical protein